MTTLQLVVTGAAEEEGLGRSLARVFGGALEVRRAIRLSGFTSRRLGAIPAGEDLLHTKAADLARTVVAEVEPGRRRDERVPDLVVVVEDLELANADQPELVVEYFRRAVVEVVARHPWPGEASRQRALERLRARCSFHLLVPMLEGYFFGDPAAPARAGARRPSEFDPARCDVERFEVDDPAFEGPPMSARPAWVHRDPWVRRRHPKDYLRFLCDPEGSDHHRVRYRETRGGVDALEHLAWGQVLARRAQARSARALFDDVARALELPCPFPGELDPLTAHRAEGGVLRNV